MAILGRVVDQHRLPLHRSPQSKMGGFLAGDPACGLLVDHPGRGSILRGCVGAGVAVALPAQAGQEDQHLVDVPGDVHRLHGQ